MPPVQELQAQVDHEQDDDRHDLPVSPVRHQKRDDHPAQHRDQEAEQADVMPDERRRREEVADRVEFALGVLATDEQQRSQDAAERPPAPVGGRVDGGGRVLLGDPRGQCRDECQQHIADDEPEVLVSQGYHAAVEDQLKSTGHDDGHGEDHEEGHERAETVDLSGQPAVDRELDAKHGNPFLSKGGSSGGGLFNIT